MLKARVPCAAFALCVGFSFFTWRFLSVPRQKPISVSVVFLQVANLFCLPWLFKFSSNCRTWISPAGHIWPRHKRVTAWKAQCVMWLCGFPYIIDQRRKRRDFCFVVVSILGMTLWGKKTKQEKPKKDRHLSCISLYQGLQIIKRPLHRQKAFFPCRPCDHHVTSHSYRITSDDFDIGLPQGFIIAIGNGVKEQKTGKKIQVDKLKV